MKISFFGHRNFVCDEKYEKRVFDILVKAKNNAQDEHIEFLLGGYGNFDRFALNCAKDFRSVINDVTITLVTPYINYQCTEGYDSVLYPSLENVPRKFAIIYRNRAMVEKSDMIIAFITHRFGGAYEAVKYAKSKGKTIINLADFVV